MSNAGCVELLQWRSEMIWENYDDDDDDDDDDDRRWPPNDVRCLVNPINIP